jgi:hypothetical protein
MAASGFEQGMTMARECLERIGREQREMSYKEFMALSRHVAGEQMLTKDAQGDFCVGWAWVAQHEYRFPDVQPGRLIPYGYSTDPKNAENRLCDIMCDPRTLLVDTRYTPFAPGRVWANRYGKSGLQHMYGDRYVFLSDSKNERGFDLNWLGNINYRKEDQHKGVKLVDERGIAKIVSLLRQECKNVVLLCTCQETYEGCHRRVIISKVVELYPEVEIVQW